MKNFILILVMVLCVSCTTNKNGDGKLTNEELEASLVVEVANFNSML